MSDFKNVNFWNEYGILQGLPKLHSYTIAHLSGMVKSFLDSFAENSNDNIIVCVEWH